MTDYFLQFVNKYFHFDSLVSPDKRNKRSYPQDVSSYSSKKRKFNLNMASHNSEGWSDMPFSSTVPRFFQNPLRRNASPLRARNIDMIDISDDDDIVPVSTKSNPITVPAAANIFSRTLSEARRSIQHCNKLFRLGNESIRHSEERNYRNLLSRMPSTASVYGSQPDKPHQNHVPFSFMEENRSKRMLNMIGSSTKTISKQQALIDLTDDRSTKSSNGFVSDPEVEFVSMKPCKVEPVNSLKKTLDTEPVMHPDYIQKLVKEYKEKSKQTEKLIEEEKCKRTKFQQRNRENMNILLEERLKNCKLSDVVILDSDEDELLLPQFTAQQEQLINEALNSGSGKQVFVQKYNLRITGADLKLLNERQWLNDEIINFYVNMIQERHTIVPNLPKVYSFSTFFYPKLISSGFSSLRRWTKRVDIFSYDIIVVPIHLGFHWCMALIDFRVKTISYYDSMFGKNTQCLTALENYLREEHRDKKKSDYDVSRWRKVLMKDIPQQMNGSDCGVFSCTFAEFVCRNAKILFTQEHMPYIRRKMALEIVQGKLLT